MGAKSPRDILLTGASGAIGTAMASALAKAGFSLHLTSRQPKKLSALQKSVKAAGANAFVYALDLKCPQSITAVVKTFMQRSANPFGLICNAGDFGVLGDFSKVSVERWISDFSQNFLSNARLLHAFLDGMKRKKAPEGSVVMLSGAGLGGNSSFAHFSCYSTAKAAVTHLVEALAPELLPSRIRINAISPGQVYSNLTETMIKAGVKRVGELATSAMRCKETGGVPPQLAAQLTEFLMSPDAGEITGRLLSARFDLSALKKQAGRVAKDPNLFKLRRIDDALFSVVKPS